MIYRIEYHLCSEATGEELKREAKSISVLFPVLEENDQFVKEAIDRVMPARMNALAIGLEKYGDIDDAGQFLGEFRKLAALENLVVYDARGNVIYGDGDFAKELNLSAEEIRAAVKNGKETDDPWVAAASVGGQWLAVGRSEETSAQKSMLNFYDWRNGLAIITADRNTCAAAIDLEDGQILFASEPEMIGRDITEAELRPEDGAAFADAKELETYFSDADRIRHIQMDGVSYYAVRTVGTLEKLFLLVMIPETQVQSNAQDITIPLFLIIMLVSGLYSAWAYFRLPEQIAPDSLREKKSSRGIGNWRRTCGPRV